MINWEFN